MTFQPPPSMLLDPRAPLLLEGRAMDYAWGERGAGAFIPRWLGVPAEGKAWAELWFGDHTLAPARIDPAGGDLRAAIDRAPGDFLGPRADSFGRRLPFLVKLLSCDRPLSIQVHPPAAAARAGFAREESLKVPLDSPQRLYKDPFAKPEVLIALTPFAALADFRPLPAAMAGLRAVPELSTLSLPASPSLSALFRFFLEGSSAVREALVSLSRRLSAENASAPFPHDRWEGWFLKAAALYPADGGLGAFFLLNLELLSPGEALFLAPGRPHAYLRGTGVEVMAPSDNVLRGGLTPKAVDVPAFLGLLSGESGSARVRPVENVYAVPGPFLVEMVSSLLEGKEFSSNGPEVWLALAGSGAVETEGGTVPLAPGRAVFVPAAARRRRVRGMGKEFRAARVSAQNP